MEKKEKKGGKPDLAVVCVNGRRRMVGTGAAAKWLGLSPMALRNIAAGRWRGLGYTEATVARVLREYPQIAQTAGVAE